MSVVRSRASQTFQSFQVDATIRDLRAGLEARHLATFEAAFTRSEFLEFAAGLGTVVHHRVSEPDGVTVFTIEDRRHEAGFRGYSTEFLDFHTDASYSLTPPRWIVIYCVEEPELGGDVFVSTAASLTSWLGDHDPAFLAALRSDDAAVFSGGDVTYRGPVLASSADDPLIRLRLDELAVFSPAVAEKLDVLHAALQATARRLPVGAGQGYAVDNSRVVHARDRCQGRRIAWRVLASS